MSRGGGGRFAARGRVRRLGDGVEGIGGVQRGLAADLIIDLGEEGRPLGKPHGQIGADGFAAGDLAAQIQHLL